MRIPADIDREDPLVFGLSARQLLIFAGTATIAWLLFAAVRQVAPVPFATAVAAPVAMVGVAIAMGQRDGMTGDRFALAALRHARSRHRLVPMADDTVRRSALRSFDGKVFGPLELPVRAVTEDGRLDLGAEGRAVLMRASPVNFRLRTANEQGALVAGFARFLNSLHEPVEVVVRSEHANLDALARDIMRSAPSLPHPALEAAARNHATFLGQLSRHHTMIRREVLLISREPASRPSRVNDTGADAMVTALAEMGLAASRLHGSEATATLQQAMTGDSQQPAALGAPGEVIRGPQTV